MSDEQLKTEGRIFADVDLDTPILRGEQTINKLKLRRPKAGELRGLSLVQLAQMNVDEVTKLLPRITTPTLTAADVAELDPADLMTIAGEIGDFLLSKAQKAAFPTT